MADPTEESKKATEDLTSAVLHNDGPAAAKAITQGGDVNTVSAIGTPLLHSAVRVGTSVTRVLLANGADVDAKDREDRTALLAIAARRDLREDAPYYGAMTRLLIGSGAHVNATDKDRRTPLHLAADMGKKEMVAALLGGGSDVDAKDKDQRTALHLAVMQGETEVVRKLIRAGADLNAQDKNGMTPLHWAYDRPELTRILIDAGADVNIKDSQGLKPRERSKEHPDTLREYDKPKDKPAADKLGAATPSDNKPTGAVLSQPLITGGESVVEAKLQPIGSRRASGPQTTVV